MPMHKGGREERSRATFSGSYHLIRIVSLQSHNLRPEKDWYPTLSEPPRLSGSSHPSSLDTLPALLQAPRLPAATSPCHISRPLRKDSWLGDHPNFYLIFLYTSIALQMLIKFFPEDSKP